MVTTVPHGTARWTAEQTLRSFVFWSVDKPQAQIATTYLGSWFYSFYFFWPRKSSG